MNDPDIDPRTLDYFRSIQDAPERDPARVERGKKAFLDEAERWKAAVSKPADSRLNLRTMHGKERIAMWKIVGSLAAAVVVFLGGGGAVVVGAQQAMPEDALYPVKTWSEDVRLWARGDTLAAMDLSLDFADRRAEELLHEADADLPVRDSVLLRLMEQDDLALGIAAQVGDADAPTALEKVRGRMEIHERVLEYLQLGVGPDESAALLQVRETVRQRLELLNGDLHDPQVRARILEQVRSRVHQTSATPAGETNRNGNEDAGPGAGAGPESGQGAGPQTEGSAVPGGGNGEGPNRETNCTCPSTCDGQGAGGNGKGNNTPVGSSGDDGCVCPTQVCTPQTGARNRGSP